MGKRMLASLIVMGWMVGCSAEDDPSGTRGPLGSDQEPEAPAEEVCEIVCDYGSSECRNVCFTPTDASVPSDPYAPTQPQ